MKHSFFKTLTILTSILMFSACQNPVIESDNTLSTSKVVPSSWIKLSNDAIALNATIDLPNGTGSDSQAYTIQSLYSSALGKKCMQLSGINRSEVRVLCQEKSDYWQSMPFFNRVMP
jgi:uncharacterized lipoprotein YajG